MAATTSSARNYWPDSACARAFWGQQELPPYRRLLEDTTAWLAPLPGQRWLDLGCGCGQLTLALWVKSGGRLCRITGLDCAAENEKAFRKLRRRAQPPADEGQVDFLCSDFSSGLARWPQAHFDGVVSGLAIQYAEAYSEHSGCWTEEGYDHLLAEVFRVLRPQGWFVFSVNVPEPAWGKVALRSLKGFLGARRPVRYLTKSWRMMRYGSWLKREARRGRFHFLPITVVVGKLAGLGFTNIEHRLSYARQAYLIRCRKPA
jgi:SAM-dependent methyltransferase